MIGSMALPQNLYDSQLEIEEYAKATGLDYPEVRFVMLDFRQMNQVAAYDGFPSRYPHWRFGMEYDRLSKSYAWGLHRIYEMVINTDPCYAYLLVSNLEVDQRLVMAHVYGHADFFKNNAWFDHTNRNMLDEMANHGTRIRRYVDKFGMDVVEEFIDRCLSLENLIDIHGPAISRQPSGLEKPRNGNGDGKDKQKNDPHRLPSKGYMDSFINPPDYLDSLKQRVEDEKEQEKQFPLHPQKDILAFLLEYAPLQPWQQDILAIVREESLYFAPQRQTKIMNEGWASYWHSHIMTTNALREYELIDYADHHSGTMATSGGRLNPYKLGIELFKDIEDRWNRGAFGSEYEACESAYEKAQWNTELGEGRKKIFEVRKIYNDIGFIDTFLTPEFAEKHQMFQYEYNRHSRQYEIESRGFDDIKRQLLANLTNFGDPYIVVQNANFKNRGELYLRHHWDETDLRVDYAHDSLEHLQALWQRPVHIETKVTDKGKMLFSYDGERHTQTLLEKAKK